MRFAIASGRLSAGERLPPVRQIAVDALVNPNTISKVWRDLEREGVLVSRPGDGVFVANDALERCCSARDADLLAQLERWVGDARSAGLTRAELEVWIERALSRRQTAKRVGDPR